MKKRRQRSKALLASILMVFLIVSLFPTTIFAVPSSIGADQIGTVEDGKVIFYSNLNGGKSVSPYAVGPTISLVSGTDATARYSVTPNTSSDYTYFYNGYSPNFSIIYSNTDDSNNGGTMVEGTTVVLSNRDYTKVQSNAQMAQYIDESDPNIHYASDYRIVAGTSGKQDVMRIEYSVTNNSAEPMYVGGRMNADTMVGSTPGYRTDRAQTIVDNPDAYINSASNPQGFLYDGGEVRKTARFVDRNDGDSSYIHGIPLTWHNIMVFNETNPLSVYYSVKPDVSSTADHFYPLPNVVDFGNYHGNVMPTGTFAPSSAAWIPLNRQISGQTKQNNSFSGNNIPSINSDLRQVVPFGDASAQSVASTDSATSIQWNKTKLEPGQTISFVYFVGQGNVDIQNKGALYYGFSSQSNRFGVENNIIQPLNLQVSLRNSDAALPVTNALVKLVYDPQLIQPLNADGTNRVKDGTINTTLNGIDGQYDYVLVSIDSIAPSTFSNVTFPVRGKNTTVDEKNTFVKAMIDFTNVDSQVHTDVSTREIQLFIPGVLEEDRSPGYIHVKHVVQGSGEVLYEYDIAGVVGNRSTSYAMDFVNYGLAPGQPEQQEDTLLRDDVVNGVTIRTHTYEYVPRENEYNLGGIIIRHMGKAENVNGRTFDVLLALEHVHGVIGDTAVLHNKEWPGYYYTPEEQTASFTERPTEIVFEYDFNPNDGQGYLDVYNNSGRVTVQHIEKATGELITRDTIIANMSLPENEADVTVHALDINSYTLADQQTKTVTVRSGGTASADFFYNQPGYVKVRHLEESTGALLFEEYVLGTVGSQAVVHSKEFTSYQLAIGQSPQNSTAHFVADLPSNTIPTLTFIYSKIQSPVAGDLLVRHVDKNDPLNVLAVELLHGAIGSDYTVAPKSIPGYQASLDSPASGSFTTQPQVVEFKYEFSTTDPIDITTIQDYLAWVSVEHREKTTGILFARSTVLGEFPYQDIQNGVTEKAFTVSASQFNGFLLDGAAQQQVTIHPGQTVTAIFQYLNNGSDIIPGEYTVVYLDKNNNRTEVGRERSVQGLPRSLVDLSALHLPPEYRLSPENVGQVFFPNSTGTMIFVLVEKIPADATQTNVLVTFEDIRGVAVRGVQDRTITGVAPGMEIEPAEPASSSITEQESLLPAESDSASLAESISQTQPEPASDQSQSDISQVLPQESIAAPYGLAAQAPRQSFTLLSAELPGSEQAAIQTPSAAADLTLHYNEMLAQCFAGVPYDLQPIVPAGYTIQQPPSKTVLFFETGIPLNGSYYLPYTVQLHPDQVNLQLSLVDEAGHILDVVNKTVPWNTAINSSTVTSYITGFSNHTIVRVEDSKGSQQIVLNEHAVYDAVADLYPVTVVMRENPPASSSIPPASSSIPPASSSIPPVSSLPPVSSGGGGGGGGETVSSRPASSSKSQPVASSSSVSSSSSSSSSLPDSQTSHSTPEQSSTSTSVSSAVSIPSESTTNGNRSFTEIVGSIMPFASYFGSSNNAFYFYLVLLILVLLLIFLLLGLSIRIQYTYVENGQRVTKTTRKFFKSLRGENGLLLDIYRQDVSSRFAESAIDVQFGWLYRGRLQNTNLKLTFQNKSLGMFLKEKPDQGKINCLGQEFK